VEGKFQLGWPITGNTVFSLVRACLSAKRCWEHQVSRFAMMQNASVQVHTFSDASNTVYGACIYFRAEPFWSVTSHLLCSTSKVAFLKTITIPMLELSAVLLLAELVSSIRHIFAIHCDFQCWSDLTIVLSWIREAPSSFIIVVSKLRTKRMECHGTMFRRT